MLRNMNGYAMVRRLSFSLMCFAVAATVNFLAGRYATGQASAPVTDIILSNVPVMDVDGLFVYGTVTLIVFIVWVLLRDVQRAPYVLNALAVFFFIRAGFVAVTHIGPFPDRIALDAGEYIANYLWGGADLFFSGHTGSPFLLALIFWREPWFRYTFLGWSAFFAVVVLVGHLHYTNDVLAALFITYSIHHLARWLFPREYETFLARRTRTHPASI